MALIESQQKSLTSPRKYRIFGESKSDCISNCFNSSLLNILTVFTSNCNNFFVSDFPKEPVPPVIRIFLFLNKYRQTSNPKISYAFHPEAIVQTLPQATVRGFFQQRVRWASKIGNYKNVLLTSTLVFVFIFNLCCLILFVMALLNTHYVMLCITFIALKIIAEALLLSKAKQFFNFKNAYTILISLQLPHIIYMVSAALFSKLKTYEWKGRILR